MAKKQNIQPIDRTELVWPGKRKEVERVELPFQTIETINLPRGKRQEELFGEGGQEGWENRLIWGDNLLIMGSLLKEYAGKINLIYIDPPFATGDDFSFEIKIGDQEITKEPSALEVKAYRDTWGKGMQSYLQMMYDRLVLMKELLADNGSIYVHMDWHTGDYVRVLMDEVFGKNNFLGEVIWYYYNKLASGTRKYSSAHDKILFYAKDIESDYPFHPQEEKRDMPVKQLKRKYFEGKAINVRDESGNVQYQMRDVRRIDDVWRIACLQPADKTENTGYNTQKPAELLERIINASSREGDLVADFFCGSGTTGVVAEKLNRRWIMSDLGRFATHTARKRLLDINAKPFIVQNLGKYERHRWVQLNGRYTNYLKFILELYHAEQVEGFTNLHGKKDNETVTKPSILS